MSIFSGRVRAGSPVKARISALVDMLNTMQLFMKLHYIFSFIYCVGENFSLLPLQENGLNLQNVAGEADEVGTNAETGAGACGNAHAWDVRV